MKLQFDDNFYNEKIENLLEKFLIFNEIDRTIFYYKKLSNYPVPESEINEMKNVDYKKCRDYKILKLYYGNDDIDIADKYYWINDYLAYIADMFYMDELKEDKNIIYLHSGLIDKFKKWISKIPNICDIGYSINEIVSILMKLISERKRFYCTAKGINYTDEYKDNFDLIIYRLYYKDGLIDFSHEPSTGYSAML